MSHHNSHDSGRRNQGHRRPRNNYNGRRPSNRKPGDNRPRPERQERQGRQPRVEAKPLTLWQKILGFFGIKPKNTSFRPKTGPKSTPVTKAEPTQVTRSSSISPAATDRPARQAVKSSRLYVGNLSYEATESDLEELFKGFGNVKSVEIIYNPRTHKSKGYAFIDMHDIEAAEKAVVVLHEQFFMGRKLTVNGASDPKTREEREPREPRARVPREPREPREPRRQSVKPDSRKNSDNSEAASTVAAVSAVAAASPEASTREEFVLEPSTEPAPEAPCCSCDSVQTPAEESSSCAQSAKPIVEDLEKPAQPAESPANEPVQTATPAASTSGQPAQAPAPEATAIPTATPSFSPRAASATPPPIEEPLALPPATSTPAPAAPATRDRVVIVTSSTPKPVEMPPIVDTPAPESKSGQAE